VADVVEAGAAIQGLPIGFDGLAEISNLPVGISQRCVQVRQLAAGGRVQVARGRPDRGDQLLREFPTALEEATPLVDAHQSSHGLGVAWIDFEGTLEAAAGGLQVAASLVDESHHVVNIREPGTAIEQEGEGLEGTPIVTGLEALTTEEIRFPFFSGHPTLVLHGSPLGTRWIALPITVEASSVPRLPSRLRLVNFARLRLAARPAPPGLPAAARQVGGIQFEAGTKS
jgi:hypothetical protein